MDSAKIVKIEMRQDELEPGRDDRFYPSFGESGVPITLSFKLVGDSWKQTDNISIRSIEGFDGDNGEKLLEKLNEAGIGRGTKIFSKCKQIYPKLPHIPWDGDALCSDAAWGGAKKRRSRSVKRRRLVKRRSTKRRRSRKRY